MELFLEVYCFFGGVWMSILFLVLVIIINSRGFFSFLFVKFKFNYVVFLNKDYIIVYRYLFFYFIG